jgi:hypothetical protein
MQKEGERASLPVDPVYPVDSVCPVDPVYTVDPVCFVTFQVQSKSSPWGINGEISRVDRIGRITRPVNVIPDSPHTIR